MKTATELKNLQMAEKKNQENARIKRHFKQANKIIKKKCEPAARKGRSNTVVSVPLTYGRLTIASILDDNGYKIDLLQNRKIKICW